jgi:DNA-binding NtrC family response regulator
VSAASRARVLIVDDEPALRRSLARALMPSYEVLTAEDGASALGLLATTRVDAVLLDLTMPEMGGAEVLARIKAAHPDVEVVVMASPAELEAAAQATHTGAYAFLLKPVEPEVAAAVPLDRAIERRRLLGRVRALEGRVGEHERFGELVCSSARMQDLYRRAMAVAASSAAVLLTGERGAGKEVVARAIHRRSSRADRAFVALSCNAIPEELVDQELFGGPHGPGALEAAGEGTLLLDEVGDLPLRAQARLLHALTRGELEGAGAPRRVAARVIAATAVDLRERVAAGRLREDLYYRLSVVSLHVPPLRQRREDIPLLAHHFLRRHGLREGREVRRIGTEAMRLLRAHAWPGNVRELEHAMEHAAIMARGEVVTPGDLPPSIEGAGGGERRRGRGAAARELAELAYAEAREQAIKGFERAYVQALMERAGGNVSEAARQAGMDRANFRRLRKRVEGTGEDGAGNEA